MSESELSPARIALLKQAIDAQERILRGVATIFRGLRASSDPQVSVVCEEALSALKNHDEILEALIDGLHETRH